VSALPFLPLPLILLLLFSRTVTQRDVTPHHTASRVTPAHPGVYSGSPALHLAFVSPSVAVTQCVTSDGE
jgi:hypothetical protein